MVYALNENEGIKAVSLTNPNESSIVDEPQINLDMPGEDALIDYKDALEIALNKTDKEELTRDEAIEINITLIPIKEAAGFKSADEIATECFTGKQARRYHTKLARTNLLNSLKKVNEKLATISNKK